MARQRAAARALVVASTTRYIGAMSATNVKSPEEFISHWSPAGGGSDKLVGGGSDKLVGGGYG